METVNIVNTMSLARHISERYGISKKQALLMVRTVLGSISRELLEGNKVVLHQFGRFEIRNRKEYYATFKGQRYVVPEHSYVHFRPYSDLMFYGNIYSL